MNKQLLCILLSLNAALVSACTPAPVKPDDLPLPIYDAGTVVNPVASVQAPTDSARSHLHAMSSDDVKALYLQCSGEATQRRLGSGEVAFCSIVYDVLLKRHFGGSFEALLAWSRQAPEEARRGGPPAQASGPASATKIAGQLWY
jgi:hypothetical protein